MIRGCTVMIHRNNRCFSSPRPPLHLHGFTVSRLQQVSIKRKNRKLCEESQSESNHWPSTTVIGLITVHQMQLSRHSYKILQQEIHSAPFNLFQESQHWGKIKLSKAAVLYRNWIHCRCHWNADPYNQTKGLPTKLHLQSSLKSIAVIISAF